MHDDETNTRSADGHPIAVPTPEQIFTLRPHGAGGFEVMAAALERNLRSLAEIDARHAVIIDISESGANHYTQALVDPEAGAWVEAVSDEFIAEEAGGLDDDARALLDALGFVAPTEAVPNYHRFLDPPVLWDLVAHLLLDPLVAVYGAGHHTELTVTVRDVGRPEDGEVVEDEVCGA